jgi:AcrR family transcriptional regulator
LEKTTFYFFARTFMSAVQPRKTQEQRSAKTQHLLARAAFELIKESGYANFRVASVAKAAGVSQGGQLHHFPSKDLMTMAAIDYAIELAERVTARNLKSYAATDDVVAAITEDSADYYFSASFDVAMDVTKAASANPDLRKSIAVAHRRYRSDAEGGWLQILLSQGWQQSEAQDLIAMTASLVRGFAIRSMIRPDRREIDRLMAVWRAMVTQYFNQP